MKYYYGEFDGEEFPTQDKLFGFDQLTDFLLQYGDKALKEIRSARDAGKAADEPAAYEGAVAFEADLRLVRDALRAADGEVVPQRLEAAFHDAVHGGGRAQENFECGDSAAPGTGQQGLGDNALHHSGELSPGRLLPSRVYEADNPRDRARRGLGMDRSEH